MTQENTAINEFNKIGPILIQAYAMANTSKLYLEMISSDYPNEEHIWIRDNNPDSTWGLLLIISI